MEQPDSRDWSPPKEMEHIFKSLRYAKGHMSIDGDGAPYAIECLIDAVESMAIYVAGDRGRRG